MSSLWTNLRRSRCAHINKTIRVVVNDASGAGMGLSFLVLGMKRGSRYITVQREWGQSESGSLQPLTRVLFLLITGSTPEDGADAARCRGKF